VVGVNAYQADDTPARRAGQPRPAAEAIAAHVERFRAFKASRSNAGVERALTALARAAHDPADNVFEKVVEAADAAATHGEIVGVLRRELGDGEPLTTV
jgi:methylmalonyl-CoA mutase, N-terminal domain